MTNDPYYISKEHATFTIRSPAYRWSTTIGDLTVYHLSNFNAWQRFWLRFIGWKVEKIDE
tara:strand:+ start:483 stop:662 length:180 start_codon:yes stop_codon:yes gene_type:complete